MLPIDAVDTTDDTSIVRPGRERLLASDHTLAQET
ncbi:uncharacterized protein Nmag_3828 (plasmid) [Natrialba magadii ATCC 43099]|uniref:Uncharacterized protein n=1 Tax=Natrialba magadii (strain ATCC 43099 / DSM 3394 / CCM 3739 / CIP 104546 / IAM 13178 / JCM 8861 / NBRC 102185 / NCIMB 2190 / MS3) TaxID=547559 RepID=D3T1B0_NATMM|nr:uncharacterized protein Nmag_3828 [Natrialba magadii ATCC 43099]ELY32439.1 hypothetical protein C500_03844 [Natrialba magadii ATCC 43099]